jgi:conjugative relaxase-like TrwC/TraI family protein
LRVIVRADGAAARSYYRGSGGEYYAEGQEHAGEWGGRGAASLGLDGRVDPAAFDALCENRHPATGERITARTKSARRCGFDLNFHVPKSVSVLYGLTGDREVLDAFRSAVRETLAEVESAVRTRVRRGGRDDTRPTANLLYSLFVHVTARPVDGVPDPHLHAHAFVFNQTLDPVEGRWKAIELGEVYRNAPYYEAAFHARLSAKLVALGFDVRRTDTGWELSGVPRRALTAFSRRTGQIEGVASELGIDSPEAKSRLGATTRERKQLRFTLADLRRLWAARLTADERAAVERVHRREVAVADRDPLAAETAMRFAVAHGFERSSVQPVPRLLEMALRHGVGRVTVEAVRAALGRPDLLVREYHGERLATTREVLAEEARVLRFARTGRGAFRPLVPDSRSVSAALSVGQRAAVEHVWRSPDRVVLVRGVAGSGKTTLMSECVAGITGSGTAVVVLAPTANAGRGVLRREGFADADTVSRFLVDTRFQERARRGVIWVDEAGLLGLKTLDRLFRVAGEIEARVVLSGDERQHRSVERGSPLTLLQRQGGLEAVAVREIRRQRGRYRDAVKLLSDGRTVEGFDLLDRTLGWVRELPDGQRTAAIADDYCRGVGEGKSVLVVSPTHAEGRRTTAAIRERLRAGGVIAPTDVSYLRLEPKRWTLAERGDPHLYREGDVVEFHTRCAGYRVGGRSTVVAVGRGALGVRHADGDEGVIPFRLADKFEVYTPRLVPLAVGDRVRTTKNAADGNGKRLVNGALSRVVALAPDRIVLEDGAVLAAGFGHLTHGYVVTSHAAQGKTVDRVLIAQSSESFPASGREQLYVSVSRGRESATVYTDDTSGLRRAITRTDPHRSATELVRPTVPAKEVWQAWVGRRLEWARTLLGHQAVRDIVPGDRTVRRSR